jgi:UDP-N-acetylmuramate dehydrogenase
MNIFENHPLREYNTFGVNVRADKFVQIDYPEQLKKIFLHHKPEKYLIIGEGSNLLFIDDFKGTIVHPAIKGIQFVKENEPYVEIIASCGENWDSFVDYCCRHNYYGIENLSLIPGTTGSAPVQNIGAYGVEVKDHIKWVEGLDIESGEMKKIMARDCEFGYRTSIFKEKLKNRFLITSVCFQLSLYPEFVLNYGNVDQVFKQKSRQDLLSLRETIIEIRKSKLPDPIEYGNAGSFFKNPVISIHQFSDLNNDYPEMPSYPAGDMIKIPAAWLIEKAGWKDVREKNIGTWPLQPLVIVNYGGASGKDIFEFSEKIRKAVEEKFSIQLEREVTVI